MMCRLLGTVLITVRADINYILRLSAEELGVAGRMIYWQLARITCHRTIESQHFSLPKCALQSRALAPIKNHH